MTPNLIKSNFGDIDAKVFLFVGSLDPQANPAKEITSLFQQCVDQQLYDCVVFDGNSKYYVYTKQELEVSENSNFVLQFVIEKTAEQPEVAIEEQIEENEQPTNE